MQSGKNHFLMVMSGPEDGRIFEIHKDQVSIGRGDENDIVMSEDSYMKTSHALLLKRDSEFYVVSETPADKNSASLPVTTGQIFTLGETEFVIKAK